MISDLRELNDVINNVANYIVKSCCENTTTGNWLLEYDDVSSLISEEDYLLYFDLIVSEVSSRKEILDIDITDKSFDIICALAYCPNYEWTPGDEGVFDCSYEEWEKTPAEPISQPLSLTRLAEIGENSIDAVCGWFKVPSVELTESLGLSKEEISRCGLDIDVNSNKSNSISYFILSTKDGKFIESFDSIDKAINSFKESIKDGEGHVLCYSLKEGKSEVIGNLLKCVGGNYNVFELNSTLNDPNIFNNPELYLSAIKAAQIVTPFDEDLWNKRTELEKKLGIFERYTNLSNDLYTGIWRVHIVNNGDHYGLNNCLIHDKPVPLIEFWDMSQDKAKFPDGQFVSRYYVDTLMSNDTFSPSIKMMAEKNIGFSLDGNIPYWTVQPSDLKLIAEWLEGNEFVLNNNKESLNNQIESAEKERSDVKFNGKENELEL